MKKRLLTANAAIKVERAYFLILYGKTIVKTVHI
jgi:hypothetical protein